MFSIKQSLKIGWEKFKTHAEVSLLSTLAFIILSSLNTKEEKFGIFSLIIFLVLAVVSIIIKIGYTKIFLRIYDGENPRFVDIFKEYKYFWTYLGSSIVCGLIILGGIVLLIIPGIFWAVRASFALLIVVDTKSGPIKSIKESFAITKGNFWKLFGFWIVMILVNILGLIVFGVGLLLTIPVTTTAMVYVYRSLLQKRAGISSEINPSPQVASN